MFLPERLPTTTTTEYRSFCYHDPGSWSFYPAPLHFSLAGPEAALYPGSSGPDTGISTTSTGPTDRLLPYGASDPRGSTLLLPVGRSRRVLPPGFDRFFEEPRGGGGGGGSDRAVGAARAGHEAQQSGESSEARPRSESPQAGREDEEDRPSSSSSSSGGERGEWDTTHTKLYCLFNQITDQHYRSINRKSLRPEVKGHSYKVLTCSVLVLSSLIESMLFFLKLNLKLIHTATNQ